jgi:adenylate cyclase
MAEKIERRLAAILSADVVGYSRLMAADEAGTLARLKAHRRDLFDPRISQHKGRLVKLMGDGALVEFASVVGAVECAVSIQQDVAARNESEPEDQRIVLRLGINLGEIIVDGDDIYGDGVNIAARMEQLAEPGGVYISGEAYRQARGRAEVDFEDLGDKQVKNIAQPVRC